MKLKQMTIKEFFNELNDRFLTELEETHYEFESAQVIQEECTFLEGLARYGQISNQTSPFARELHYALCMAASETYYAYITFALEDLGILTWHEWCNQGGGEATILFDSSTNEQHIDIAIKSYTIFSTTLSESLLRDEEKLEAALTKDVVSVSNELYLTYLTRQRK